MAHAKNIAMNFTNKYTYASMGISWAKSTFNKQPYKNGI